MHILPKSWKCRHTIFSAKPYEEFSVATQVKMVPFAVLLEPKTASKNKLFLVFGQHLCILDHMYMVQEHHGIQVCESQGIFEG